MKNMLGEECKPQKLTFQQETHWLVLRRGGQFAGYIARNGWNGKARSIDYPKGVPVLSSFQGELSLPEMARLVTACKRLPELKKAKK
jgi:hypothetical protein